MQITQFITSRFSGQLKGRRNHYMFPLMKAEILSEVKVEPITNQSRSSLKVISLPLIFV